MMPCPLCGGAPRERYRVQSADVAQHHVLAQRDAARHAALQAHIEALWGGSTCRVLDCTACGFGYPDPYVAGDARFFALAFQRHAAAYPAWKWEYDQTRDALATLRREGALGAFRYLELGAGDGAFVRAVTPAFTPRDHVFCTEYDAYAVDALRAYGVACLAGDVRALDPAAHAPFDVVALFQVIQHLDGLPALLAHLNGLTRPGAHLFVGAPNAARIAFHEAHGGLMDYPPSVAGRWTPEAFARWGAPHGWRVRACRTEPTGRLALLKEFAVYRHLRRAQRPGTLTNRVEAVRARRLRRVLQLPTVAAHAAAALPAVLTWQAPTGHADWVWLQRAG